MPEDAVSRATPDVSAASATRIAPGVFVFTAGLYTTTTTVVAGADGGCLVIDPAITPADLAALGEWLTGHGLRPVAGWSTHPHWDHVLWSEALGADVPRYATPAAVAVAALRRGSMYRHAETEAPGHDPVLFARLIARAEDEIGWDGPVARIVAHDAHERGHGAIFLPETGVLIAGDMCSDIETPLVDPDSGDPFGTYREGLGKLASVPGVRAVVPGHGHPGEAEEFRRRVAADFAYLDAVETGGDVADPRLAGPDMEWLRQEHARQAALAQPALSRYRPCAARPIRWRTLPSGAPRGLRGSSPGLTPLF